eukprot:TRINITY_DN519_c0_g1_i1.p1 TRINITY_DN519_c0_g1~~TRINITY_DN519_c0_g1_i1.p1  ORF type:complete len:641 (-),score=148.73 TRINITY_DN519_c0_g1_i1:262-2184(-)
MSDDENLDEWEEEAPPSISISRQRSDMSTASYGSWDGDVDDDPDSDSVLRVPQSVKQMVIDDAAEAALIDRVECTIDEGMNTYVRICVGLKLDHLKLDPERANCWGVDLTKQIVIKFDFGIGYIQDRLPPKVTVWQAGSHQFLERFSLGWTLADRIKQEFSKVWPVALNPREARFRSIAEVMETTQCDYFTALDALKKNRNNTHEAINYVCSNDQKLEDDDEAPTEEISLLQRMFGINSRVAKMALSLEGTMNRAKSLLQGEDHRKLLEEAAAQETPENRAKQRLEAHLKQTNFLVWAILFLESKLRHINRHCLICDEILEFEGLKPAVCSRAVCCMSYAELGLGFDLGSEIENNPEVTDLVISMTYVAAMKNRLMQVTPIGVQSKDAYGQKLTFLVDNGDDEKKVLDLEKLRTTLHAIPSVSEMKDMLRHGVFQSALDDADFKIRPLLQWILTSNRAHLRKLHPHELIPEITSPHQFVLISSTPEKEAIFQRLKREAERHRGEGKGSIYAWHGSPVENWHNILRTGLRNMSNTQYMLNGAAYGQGIYMAQDIGTSIGYCRLQGNDRNHWEHSMFGQSMFFMTLCEVVNHADLKPPNPYYVVPNEEWVMTRFFFVFSSSSQPQSCNANNLTIPKVFSGAR